MWCGSRPPAAAGSGRPGNVTRRPPRKTRPSPMSDGVRVETAGPVGTIWLDHPPVNAATMRMLQALQAALHDLERRSDIRCVILTGAGERAFCAGADLREQQALTSPADSAAFRSLARQNRGGDRAMPQAGGGGHWRLVHRRRHRAGLDLRHPHRRRGRGVPHRGRLSRRAAKLGHGPGAVAPPPRPLAGARFAATGGRISGRSAPSSWGWSPASCPAPNCMPWPGAAAMRIASASPAAILATRRAVHAALWSGCEAAAAVEEAEAAQLSAHPDAREGTAAFLEKRPPRFEDP